MRGERIEARDGRALEHAIAGDRHADRADSGVPAEDRGVAAFLARAVGVAARIRPA